MIRLALALALLAACGGSAARPARPTDHPTRMTAADQAALTIPATEATRPALERLARLDGDVPAGFARLHYLVDLFDHARVIHDEAARRLLAAALGVDAGRGPRSTDAVLDALLILADRVLARDRLHAGTLAARTLLDQDRHPPEDRAALFPRMTALKSIARGGGPLAPNALLRLHDICAGALAETLLVPVRGRPERLATCLYPLWDADPAPYFAADPAKRPPEPDWRDLVERSAGLVTEIGRAGGRLAPLAARLASHDRALVDKVAPGLPVRRDPRELRLPAVAAALPYDWTPLLLAGDGSKPSAVHVPALTPRVREDGRGRVTVALTADARGEALHDAADAARAAGATQLALAVSWAQAVRPPAGDYWYGRVEDGRIARLGMLPLLLTPAPRATLGLHLVVATGEWRVVAREGAFPPVPVTEDAVAATRALREQWAAVRRAFPDEGGVYLVVQPGVSMRAVAQAIEATRAEFRDIALARSAPSAGTGLWERISGGRPTRL